MGTQFIKCYSLGRLWTPTEISKEGWFDAYDNATIIADSNRVLQWRDKSGNSRHITQATESLKLLFQSTGFNGLPAVYFDGTGRFLKNASYQPTGAITVIAVYRATSPGSLILVKTNAIFEVVVGSVGAGYSDIIFTGVGSGVQINSRGFSTANALNSNNILCVQYNGSGHLVSDYSARFNGVSQSVVSSGAVGYFAETGFTIGRRSIQGNLSFNGVVSEILFFNSFPSSSVIEKAEGYLAHKWQITSMLPVGHPHKNTPPYV